MRPVARSQPVAKSAVRGLRPTLRIPKLDPKEAQPVENAQHTDLPKAVAVAGTAGDADKPEEIKKPVDPKTQRPTPPKAPPNFKEKETDSVADARPKIQDKIGFNANSTTLNLMAINNGQLLTSISDEGFQYLLAGARANIGFSAGRYVFEVSLIERRSRSFSEPLVRIGFSTSSASLLLGSNADDSSVCFDLDGYFVGGGARKRITKKFEFDEAVCVLLNLDEKHPNAWTMSLYRNGVRAADPQALPANVRGQPLFPAVAFRGAVLRVNFSEALVHPLKFRCPSVQEAATDDCVVIPSTLARREFYEVIFPIALPGEGFYDWLENFLDDHKEFVEFSARAGRDWISRSDVGDSNTGAVTASQLAELLAISPRHCVLAEVRNNLTVDGRKAGLERFADPWFKKIAVVAVGEPPDSIKERAVKANEGSVGTGKEVWFRRRDIPDIPQQELAMTFTGFSFPDESEGFDEIRYDWHAAKQAQEHLNNWINNCKLTRRIEDLQPSKWFQTKWAAWQKAYKDWEKKQAEWKSIMETLSEWKKEGGDEKDEAATDTDPYNLEVFKVKDINDIGEGEPLFANFEYEDWCLLSLRFESQLLCHAFRKDVNDPDRPYFLEQNFGFYYELYYKKEFNLEIFGLDSLAEVFELVSDAVRICPDRSVVEPLIDESKMENNKALDYFMRMTEEHRRLRLRRTDAGDETAILKFSKPGSAAKPPKAAKAVQETAPQQAAPETISLRTPASKPRVEAPKVPLKTAASKLLTLKTSLKGRVEAPRTVPARPVRETSAGVARDGVAGGAVGSHSPRPLQPQGHAVGGHDRGTTLRTFGSEVGGARSSGPPLETGERVSARDPSVAEPLTAKLKEYIDKKLLSGESADEIVRNFVADKQSVIRNYIQSKQAIGARSAEQGPKRYAPQLVGGPPGKQARLPQPGANAYGPSGNFGSQGFGGTNGSYSSGLRR